MVVDQAEAALKGYLEPQREREMAVLRMLGDAFPKGRDGGELAALRKGPS